MIKLGIMLVASMAMVPLAHGEVRDVKKFSQATEADPRLHADGKGWRLSKAGIKDPSLPRVLLIGDSILNGYNQEVIAALSGKANVDVWVHPYFQSEALNTLLAGVLSEGPYDVVHFNMGLHGWPKGRIKDGTFEPLTKAFIEVIRTKLPKARIIWASSTPVMLGERGKPKQLDTELNATILEHNRMAARVMQEMGVPINDFHALLADKLDLSVGDKFHWRAPAYKILAEAATASITRELALEKKGAL
jgi:hypothetical protein